MKIICEITDKDILGIDGICNAKPRYTARAILKNSENLYAVMYSERFNLYSLPGGGVEDGEDKLQALERELLEETGCSCDCISEIGCVYENRNHCNYTQYSYYYFVETKGKICEAELTESEINNKTQVQWYPFSKVKDLVFNQNLKTSQQKFLQARDKAALSFYIDNYDVYSDKILIKEVKKSDLSECADVIRKSFKTVADDLGFTKENAPMHTAFSISEEKLLEQYNNGRKMFAYFDKNKIAGFYSIEFYDGECELNNLCVLPEYRNKGVGRRLLGHSFEIAERNNAEKMNISIVEENKVLKSWYENFGFVPICTKKFDGFPFTCGYLTKNLNPVLK